MCENILACGEEKGMLMLDGLYTFCTNNRLPPVCRAFAIISLHLSLMESEVTGARGNVLINVLVVTSVASLLLLELLLELLWDQSETTTWTSIHVDHQEERPPGCFSSVYRSIRQTLSVLPIPSSLPGWKDQFIPFLFRFWTSL